VKSVTALRGVPRGRVAVELDGAPWRVLPAAAVVRAGLAVGVPLDRRTARALGRELRRASAEAVALRSLRSRDRSRRGLEERLERASIAPAQRAETLGMLERTGLVDDARFAVGRAEALAARGYGDAAVEAALEREHVSAVQRAAALAALEPEVERAHRIVERRGRGVRTARLLASKGFAEDAVAVAFAGDFAPDG
jgi:SOS response regulatory protein OraA/RecX